jgi:hypothetical protein
MGRGTPPRKRPASAELSSSWLREETAPIEVGVLKQKLEDSAGRRLDAAGKEVTEPIPVGDLKGMLDQSRSDLPVVYDDVDVDFDIEEQAQEPAPAPAQAASAEPAEQKEDMDKNISDLQSILNESGDDDETKKMLGGLLKMLEQDKKKLVSEIAAASGKGQEFEGPKAPQKQKK